MILYIPASEAPLITVALWHLAKPAALRTPQDTSAMFSVKEALDKSQWLEVETTFEIALHPQAELGEIVEILQPYEGNGSLPAGTVAELTAYIEANRGRRITVYDAFPNYFKGVAQTEEQMIAAALLADPEVMT